MCNGSVTITCIIPAYNSEQWIGECLDSALEQTSGFDEIIVINDGSTDHTESICKIYCSNENKIRLISHENKRQGACRNEGIKLANSEYIMFLDSDDAFVPETVEKLRTLLHDRPDCVYFDAKVFGDMNLKSSGDIYDRLNTDTIISSTGKQFFDDYYPKGFLASAPLAIYKRDFLQTKGILFPEKIFYEDNLFAFQCAMKANEIIYFPQRLYRRRYRKDSTMTSAFDTNRYCDYLECASLIYKYVLSMKRDCISKAVLDYVISWAYGFVERFMQLKSEGKIAGLDYKKIEDLILGFDRIILQYYEGGDDSSAIEKIPEFQISSVYISQGLINNSSVKKRYQDLLAWGKEYYRGFFNKLGIGVTDGEQIAIYGTGKHTKAMLDVYEKLNGRPANNVVFVDSFQAGNCFRGEEIRNTGNLEDVSKIVISVRSKDSYEIYDNLKRQYPMIKIINLFDLYQYNLFRYDEYLFNEM
ncbi:glycosyltransferase family 2 protein [Butyrivibrio sp. AE2032]|uniref:glycosyltransferase family 2 protein n=1 Tax=Butyrivibrio sp. AE2032 TaxID=1458463 RepID=UPI00054F4860|nr:glycosyltransferase family 2 protein [Butyrivibrio sp. AE2032]